MIEYGLKSFKFKATGDDTLESLGKIAEGTVKWNSDKPTKNPFYSAQEPDYPSIIIADKAGLKKVNFSLMEIDPDNLVRLFGGVATGVAPNKTWAAPRSESEVVGAAELITESGLKFTLPKAQLSANFNWDISRKAISNIEVELTVMLPDLDTDSPYTLSREV